MSESIATNDRPKTKFILQLCFEESSSFWSSFREFDSLQEAEDGLISSRKMKDLHITAQRIVRQTVSIYKDKDQTIVYYN